MSKNAIKTICIIILAILSFALLAYVTIYWYQHRDMTQMQVFIKYWWLYLLSICALFAALYIDNTLNE